MKKQRVFGLDIMRAVAILVYHYCQSDGLLCYMPHQDCSLWSLGLDRDNPGHKIQEWPDFLDPATRYEAQQSHFRLLYQEEALLYFFSLYSLKFNCLSLTLPSY